MTAEAIEPTIVGGEVAETDQEPAPEVLALVRRAGAVRQQLWKAACKGADALDAGKPVDAVAQVLIGWTCVAIQFIDGAVAGDFDAMLGGEQ